MLHKHAATIRPYPPPTRPPAAARPNSRQIRQMSAIPADLPFHSQFAARPNNRRHRHPTATHPQTTSTPNLSQTLMISRQTLTRAPLRQRRPSHPENPPNIPKITVQTTRPTQITAHPQYPKNHSSDNGQTLARPPASSRRPSHPENPPKSQKSQFRQSPQRKSQPIPKIPVPCTNGVTKNQKPETINLPTARSGAFVL